MSHSGSVHLRPAQNTALNGGDGDTVRGKHRKRKGKTDDPTVDSCAQNALRQATASVEECNPRPLPAMEPVDPSKNKPTSKTQRIFTEAQTAVESGNGSDNPGSLKFEPLQAGMTSFFNKGDSVNFEDLPGEDDRQKGADSPKPGPKSGEMEPEVKASEWALVDDEAPDDGSDTWVEIPLNLQDPSDPS